MSPSPARRRAAGAAVVVAAVVALGGPAGAASGPDLAAFTGCVSAHSAAAASARGEVPPRSVANLVRSALAGSRTKGAARVARRIDRAPTDAALRRAVEAAAAWCTAAGVPPITVPTTVPVTAAPGGAPTRPPG